VQVAVSHNGTVIAKTALDYEKKIHALKQEINLP
jgi:hypothetical protein